jgi:opacity protein-like surface antigen
MRRILYAAVVIVLLAGVAAAQDFPKVEVFGGYSLARIGFPNDLSTALDLGVSASDITTHRFIKKGFDASFTYNATSAFGVEADFKYNSGDILSANVSVGGVSGSGQAKLSSFAFMAGPHFAARKSEAVTPFAHALFGIDRGKISGHGEAQGQSANVDFGSDTGFAMALGGGLDVKVHKNVAIRLIQADYFLTKHESESWNNVALAFGVVFRFSGK